MTSWPMRGIHMAPQLWPAHSCDRIQRRRSWDSLIRRLRIKLREAGIREELVRNDGHGNVELFLLPADLIVDET